MSDPKVRKGKLSEFRPQQVNANDHTERGMSLLEGEMQQDGYVAPMTVAADHQSIDGSARLEVAATVFGDTETLVVEHDGTRPIVMVRTDIESAETEQAQRISVAANRIAQVNLEWDIPILAQLPVPIVEKFWTQDEVEDWHIRPPDAGSDGSLLSLVDVTIKDPRHAVSAGEVYAVGPHILIVVDVFTDWPIWIKYLKPGSIFAPFPGPFVALAEQSHDAYLIMVQPDPYIAGHILDHYEDVHGAEAISLVR